MDDAQWLFKQDSKEKKITARSARKKVYHAGCKLPSDYMSKKEIRNMNGEVKIMNLRKPMSYAYFKTMPKELQEEYLTYLRDTFDAAISDIAKMMGCNANALSFYINHTKKTGLNVKFPRHPSKLNKEAWAKFLDGTWNASESDEKARSETNDVSKGSEPVSENASESDEKDHGEFDKVMNEVAAGFITLNDAMDILGLPRVPDGDVRGIQVPEGMTREEWLGELNKNFDEFAKRQKRIIEDENQQRISDLKAEIERLEKELKARTVDYGYPYPWTEEKPEYKPYNLDIDETHFTIRDLKSWDELFDMLRRIKLPECSIVGVDIQKR